MINRWPDTQAGVPYTPCSRPSISASVTGICAAIGKRDTQSREVDTRLTRVLVNHRRISKILAETEVRREEVPM